MSIRLTLIAWTFFFCLSSARSDELADKLHAIMDGPDYKQAVFGVLVVDAGTGKIVYERSPDKLFTPASTTKLFSCAAALSTLGPDFRFETPVYRRGEVNKDGVLHGDLILVASGDLTMGGRTGKNGKTLFTNGDHTYANSGLGIPELTDSNPLAGLEDLAKQIAKSGIKEIRGEVAIDERLFARTRSSGSGPEVVSPMIINDNVVDVVITPGAKAGDAARIRVRPETAFAHVDADVATVEKGANKTAAITLQPVSPNHFLLRGTIPEDAKPAIRYFPIDEPILFARTLLLECLRREGVRFSCGLIRPGEFDAPEPGDYAKMTKVASFKSAPFSEMITVTLKVSHNLYASTMPLLVASKSGQKNAEQGLRLQGKFLKELGVDTDSISFAGGAGGANADAVTPRATVQLLQAMSKRPEAALYFDSLPVMGVDGTLAETVGADSPAKGKVRAKTGTLVWYDAMNDRMLLRSKALAGELTTAKGSKLYFALFLNNAPLPKGVSSTRDGKVLGKICEVLVTNGP